MFTIKLDRPLAISSGNGFGHKSVGRTGTGLPE